MYILLDGISNKELGLSLTSRPEIPSAEQEVEHIEVEGRHGSLTKKGSYKDIIIPMEFSFLGVKTSVKERLREIKRWILNKEKLVFSDDLDFFYGLKNIVLSSTVNDIDIYGRVAIDFVCSPFQYEFIDPITVSESPAVLINPGTIESAPLLKIFGTGNIAVTVNNNTFKINGMADYVTVDCELEEAHRNGYSRNNIMVGSFPTLEIGENNISWSNGITKIIIEPRWRYT